MEQNLSFEIICAVSEWLAAEFFSAFAAARACQSRRWLVCAMQPGAVHPDAGPQAMQAELKRLEQEALDHRATVSLKAAQRKELERQLAFPLQACSFSDLHGTLMLSVEDAADGSGSALLGSALERLATAVDAAEPEDVGVLSELARGSGALLHICSAVEHQDLRIHQSALALLANFTTTEVDPQGCDATKAAFKTIVGGFAHGADCTCANLAHAHGR